MSERTRLIALIHRVIADWRVRNDGAWPLATDIADAVMADRRERDVTAVEHMEARVEAAEARAVAAERRGRAG